MRKTNQPKKSANWSDPKCSHIFAGSFSSEEHTLPACSCRQPCSKHLRATNSELRTEIPGLGKLPRPAGWQPALPQKAQLLNGWANHSTTSMTGKT
jgi:hypothetical protein